MYSCNYSPTTYDISWSLLTPVSLFALQSLYSLETTWRRHWPRAAMLPTPGPTMVVRTLNGIFINIWWQKEKTWYLQKQWALHSWLSNKVTTLTHGPPQWANSTRSFTVQTKEPTKNGWWVVSRERCMNQWSKANRCDILHYPDMAVFRLGTASGSSIIRVYFAPLRCVKS